MGRICYEYLFGLKTANTSTCLRTISPKCFSFHRVSAPLWLRPSTFPERTFLKALSAIGRRATLSPIIGFLCGFGLIALPLHSVVTQGSYEDIYHSGLSGFKVFPGEKGKINRGVKEYYGGLKNHLENSNAVFLGAGLTCDY